MRPYKKRSFHSHLQSSENNMEAENSEDSEKQVSSSPPIEDADKDKDKEGETKRRKRWKRKISRKQFRHHDIKLFTPGEYRTSSLLKQKDSSPTITKKPEIVSKESITEQIITTLVGQKQTQAENKVRMEEAADSTTKNDAEENNNTNGVQNNNSIGKHNLPAIIMETPSTRRRSIDNTNIAKSTIKSLDPQNVVKTIQELSASRRISVDMPLLNQTEQSDKPVIHSRLAGIIQDQTNSFRNNGSKLHVSETTLNEKVDTNRVGGMDSCTTTTVEQCSTSEVQNMTSAELTVSSTELSQNHLRLNKHYEEQVENNSIEERQQKNSFEPMETQNFIEEQPEPENLSLKRRHSVEIPVDLSKKNSETKEQRQNYYCQKEPQTKEQNSNKYENSHGTMHYQQTHSNDSVREMSRQTSSSDNYARNVTSNHSSHRNSPENHHLTPTYSKKVLPQIHNQLKPHTYPNDNDTLEKIASLNTWRLMLKRFLEQSFSLQILDLMAHAYDQLERAKDDSCIPSELRMETQKLLSETYRVISDELKQLNLDVNPSAVIKILSQSENSQEKNTLQHYMEHIQRIRKAAIVDKGISVSQITTSQLSKECLEKHYREFLRSPPSEFATHFNQIRYQKTNNVGPLQREPSPRTTDPYSLPGHHRVPRSRAEDHHMSPEYHREQSPREGDHSMFVRQTSITPPRSAGYTSPPTQSKESTLGSNEHIRHLELPLRPGEYPIPQDHTKRLSPRTGENPLAVRPTSGDYLISHRQIPSPRTADYPLPLRHSDGSVLQIEDYSLPPSKENSPRNSDYHILHEFSGAPSAIRKKISAQLALHGRPRYNGDYPPVFEHRIRSSDHNGPMDYLGTTAKSGDHPVPINYPPKQLLQQGSAYNNYLLNELNPNQFLHQYGRKEPKSSAAAGRPRSKSDRNNADHKNGQQNLRRSISNPQAPMENPLLSRSYLEESVVRMPPPKVPTSTQSVYSFSQPNQNPPTMLPPNQVQNKETLPATTTSFAVAHLKTSFPPLYSEVFHQNLHNHVSKGNPLAISVHPLPRYRNKAPSIMPNIHSLAINEGHMDISNSNVRDPEKIPGQPLAPRKPATPSNKSPTEDNISSSTDRLEILRISQPSEQPAYEKPSMPESVVPKPTETLKNIPAVIVADKSMQITKETTVLSIDEQKSQVSTDKPEENDTRMSVSSNSNDYTSSSEENLRQTFDKEQDENNTEFLVWLEKLKSNEKLKRKFLNQMGIIKKEEPIFLPGGDPIEIVDSDEENSSGPQKDKKVTKKPERNSPKITSEETSGIKPKAKTNYAEQSHPQEKLIKITISPNTFSEEKNRTTAPESFQSTYHSAPKESLSKNKYIPPIPLPYVPISNGPIVGHSPASKLNTQKVIYSPEIEPISPVNNDANFVFPDVPNVPKLLPPAPLNPGERIMVSDSVTSPTYHKRKGSLEEKNVGTTRSVPGYPHDNSVKRRKSLERPQATKSPRVAPSGKLCYVRESHMFLRYYDDTQVELFVRNLSNQDEDLLRTTGLDQDKFNSHKPSNFSLEQPGKTEILQLPRDVEFSEKEDIPEVEEFIKETSLVEQFVPKDFADFYKYVTGFQIVKNKHPVSLQTFLTMYNTNRTSELLRKYLERDEVTSGRLKS